MDRLEHWQDIGRMVRSSHVIISRSSTASSPQTVMTTRAKPFCGPWTAPQSRPSVDLQKILTDTTHEAPHPETAGPPLTTHKRGPRRTEMSLRAIAEGNIPCSIVSWIASASLTALKKRTTDTDRWPKERLFDVSQRRLCWLLFRGHDAQRSWDSNQKQQRKPSSTPSDDGSRNTTTTKNDAS